LKFKPIDPFTTYKLRWRIYGQSWDGDAADSRTEDILSFGNECAIEAVNCEPGQTYECRLIGIGKNGDEILASNIVTVDTVMPDCNNTPGKCCIIS